MLLAMTPLSTLQTLPLRTWLFGTDAIHDYYKLLASSNNTVEFQESYLLALKNNRFSGCYNLTLLFYSVEDNEQYLSVLNG
jgi:hypothetical protein